MAKLPQKQNDIAIAMTIALGSRQFRFMPMRANHDDKFTAKLQAVFARLALRAGYTVHYGTSFSTLRRITQSHATLTTVPKRKQSVEIKTQSDHHFPTPRDLAVFMLDAVQKVERL